MEELKCPICKTEYSDSNPPRLLTMCGHTFCHQCIKTLIKRKEYRYQIRCPEDKLKLNLDSPTPSQFPRNMIVVQGINKLRPKVEVGEEKNEFLVFCEGMAQKSSLSSAKSSLLLTKRSSIDEGKCLLHQKPLDIICLQEKVQTCAECALFGVHRGHTCTTIKDLEVKRREWIHQLAQIIEQRKNLQESMKQKVFADHFSLLLKKKKEDLFQQTKNYFRKLKDILQERQFELKEGIQKELALFQQKTNSPPTVSSKNQQAFKLWQQQVLSSMEYLQADDIIKQIAFFAQMLLSADKNLISKGRIIIKQLKQQQQIFWTSIESNLQFPKISFSQGIEQELRKAIQLVVLPKPPIINENVRQSKQYFDVRTTIQDCSTPQFEEISLLDITDNFKYKCNLSTINDSHNQSKILTDNSFLPNLDSSYSVELHPGTIKKVKSKDSLFNNSLSKISDKRNNFNSPKHRKKTQFVSKGTIQPPSPVFLKNKIKRNVLKVKDPQKFQKIIKALEADTLQIADFTGLQMGDQTVKQVCDKLKKSTKVRSLRLMKNQLTDEILPQLFQSTANLQIINLSQNAFTSKIFEHLERQAKKDESSIVKYFQLGQNNINPRKYKEKIEELKRFGYIISL